MLVLSRKLGEKIHIGDNIVIVITEIDRGKVRVGITAPREVDIMRGELLPADPKAAVSLRWAAEAMTKLATPDAAPKPPTPTEEPR